MSDSLYSDKITAVIREYSCNAFDANIEAGKPNLPIRISLPNIMTPELRIRDFGAGLSKTEIDEIYIKYCKSTKRGNNNTVGMLGIGAKSWMAYGELFTVISYQNGVKTTYQGFKDEKKMGRLAPMDVSATDEADGIEIVIPAKHYDCEEFKEKAINLFKYWKVKPEVHGCLEWNDLIKREEPDFSGTCWSVRRNNRAIALMGGVPYPIDRTAMGDIEENEGYLLNAGIELDFNIGELDFTPNREQLQYTDKTKDALHAKLKTALDEVNNEVLKKVANCTCLWDVKKIYRSLFLTGAFSGNLRHLLAASKLKWGNFEVSNTYFDLPSDFYTKNNIPLNSVVMNTYHKHRKTIKCESTDQVGSDENLRIFFNDLPKSRSVKSRIRPLFNDYNNPHVFVINYDTIERRDLFLDAMGLTGAPIELLSSLPIAARIANSPDAKNLHKLFEFVPDMSEHTDKKNHWAMTEVDIDEDDGVYIEIDHYKVTWKGEHISSYFLNEVIDALKDLGEDIPKIYGFKKGFLAKNELGEQWQNLQGYVKDIIEEKIAELNLTQDLADTQEIDGIDSTKYLDEDLRAWRGLKKDSPFAELIRAYWGAVVARRRVNEKRKTLNILDQFKLGYEVGKGSSRFKLKKLVSSMQERYPLLSSIHNKDNYWESLRKQDVQKIVNYVNLVDSAEKAGLTI